MWMGFIQEQGRRPDLWKSRLTSFDPSLLDCLTPLLGFVLDELAIVSGGERKLRRAKVSKLRFNFRLGQLGIDIVVELADDLRRRIAGGRNPDRSGYRVPGHELANRWDFRQCLSPRETPATANARSSPALMCAIQDR